MHLWKCTNCNYFSNTSICYFGYYDSKQQNGIFSDALGHSALTGIALGMILGISNMNISMILFAVVFALLLNYVKIKQTMEQIQ